MDVSEGSEDADADGEDAEAMAVDGQGGHARKPTRGKVWAARACAAMAAARSSACGGGAAAQNVPLHCCARTHSTLPPRPPRCLTRPRQSSRPKCWLC